MKLAVNADYMCISIETLGLKYRKLIKVTADKTGCVVPFYLINCKCWGVEFGFVLTMLVPMIGDLSYHILYK